MEKPRMLKRPETRLVGLENEIMDITTPSAGATKDMHSTKIIHVQVI